MAEPVLDPDAVAGELGELTAFATLNAFHNDWIAADGTRELQPADFLGGLSSWTHITTLGAAHTFTGDGTSGKWGNLGNIGSSLDLGAPQQPATVHAFGIGIVQTVGFSSAYPTHPVSPNPYTVPDLRNNADPNLVIDPSLVKDSTAGLQTYIDSCPSNAQIFLPFDLVCNGSIHLFGTQQLTVVNPVNGKKKLIRKESHPWRVRADRRTTLPASLGGGPNPAYNPNGVVCDWQYDIFGGQANIPTSQRNPWGQIVANSIDATHPNGIMRTDGDPTLVTPARSSGSDVGGFNGSTGVSGVDYDGVHFYVHYPSYTGGDGVRVASAPFTTANTSGKILQVQTLPGGNGVLFNHFISSVSVDHKTAFFDNNDNSSVFQETSGTSAWAIFDNNSQGWNSFFVPNPKWEQEHDLSHNSTNGQRFFSGTIPKPWTGISDALNDAMSRNQDPIVALHDSATLVGIEVSGSNTPVGTQLTQWQGAISGVVKSAPMIMEFTHGVATDTTDNKLILCDIHNIPGHGEQGPGQILSGTKIHEVGMQAATAHWDGKIIDRSIFYGTSHASFDIESTGHEGPITITNNTFGGPHGMSWSSAADGLTYTGNHSVAADLVSHGGPIPDSFGLSNYTRVNFWLGGRNGFRSTNVVISNNQFDIDSSAGTDEVPAFIIGNCDGLTVTNNTTPIGTSSAGQYFLQPYIGTGDSSDDTVCTVVECSGNVGGPYMIGQLPPGYGTQILEFGEGNWPSFRHYGTGGSLQSATLLQIDVTATPGCNPAGDGHYRTDWSNIGTFDAGVESYCSIPVDFPNGIPSVPSGKWFQFAEAKTPNNPGGYAEWGLYVRDKSGGGSEFYFQMGRVNSTTTNGTNHPVLWHGGNPLSGWNTFVVRSNYSTTTNGFLTLYLNGTQVFACSGVFILVESATDLDLNNYTGCFPDPCTDTVPPCTVLHGVPRIGGSLAAVQQPGGWNATT